MKSVSQIKDATAGPSVGGRHLWTSCILAIVGILISILVFQLLRHREDRVLEAEFRHRTNERAMALQREFELAQLIVESLAAFEQIRDHSLQESYAFAELLIASHTTLHGLGFNAYVRSDEREAFEAKMQAEGYPEFQIKEAGEAGLVRAADRPEYFTVEYIAPFAGNEKALGFDIYSEPTRREALDRARARKKISATGPVKLVQETEEQMGFLLCRPMYGEDGNLYGLATGVFRLGDLMEAALKNFASLEIEIVLQDEYGEEPLVLYRNRPAGGDYAHDYERLQEKDVIQLGGRSWVLRTTPLAGFAADYRTAVPWIALFTGLLITFLLIAYLHFLGLLNARLRVSEDRFRQIAENITEVFWITDPSGLRISYVSPAFKRVYGRSEDELYADGQVFLDAIHPDDREHVKKTMQLLGQGQSVQSQYRVVHPDGKVRWLRDRGFPVIEEEGQVRCVVGIVEDITMRHKLEEERDQLQAKIQQAQKMEGLGVLAGGMAHDYNNLLTAILGHAELLLNDLPEDSPSRTDVEQIEKAGQRAAELTRQMLAYSGRGHFFKRPITLTDIVSSMKELIHSTVSNRAEIDYCLDPMQPPMKGDANQIRQAVLNLVQNASESVEELKGKVTITTGSIKADPDYLAKCYFDHELLPGLYVFLEVSDDGAGMEPATIEKIFDPFFTTRFVGRGLGLPAVIGIVRGHDGAIVIESKVSKGSSFTLLFPVFSSDDTMANEAPSDTATETPPAHH